MSTVNLGLIGAGRIGRVHAETITRSIPEARIVSVADVFVKAAAEASELYGIPKYTEDPEDIFSDPSIDAVLICSSTDTHAEFIERAARAGKHVFCEKPISHDLSAIDRALDAVESAGVKLQIGFQRRFDPNFRRVRELIENGSIGKPYLVHIISRDPAPPPIDYIKVSGGIFLDMTIHDFDMARFLLGEEVQEIYAIGGTLVDPTIAEAGDIDTALITFEYESGAMGTIDNCRKAVYGYDQRVEVFGSGGRAMAHNETPTRTTFMDGTGLHSDKPLHFFLERYRVAYAEEMRAFVRSIVEDTEPPVTGLDGKIPVVMGLAAWKSLKGHRPVRLEEITAEE